MQIFVIKKKKTALDLAIYEQGYYQYEGFVEYKETCDNIVMLLKSKQSDPAKGSNNSSNNITVGSSGNDK